MSSYPDKDEPIPNENINIDNLRLSCVNNGSNGVINLNNKSKTTVSFSDFINAKFTDNSSVPANNISISNVFSNKTFGISDL